MVKRLHRQRKGMMAASLMLLFLPLGIYVTAEDRSWSVLAGRFFPDYVVQFVVSTIITYWWISLAEWVQLQLHRHGGVWLDQLGPLWSNMIAGTVFFVVSMTGFALVLLFTEWLFYNAMQMNYPQTDLRHASRAMNGLYATLSLCVYVLIANTQSIDQMEEVRLKTEQLEKENLLSQYGALKSQVNPHFLFNSLSILSSLVKKDPDLSEQFIERLSRAYRYILEQRDTDVVPLEQELDFLLAYTFLLQTRFEHKFSVHVEVDDDHVHLKIPALTLQLLVENAVKHNRMSEKEPLEIVISNTADSMLEVRNVFRPRGEKVESTGIGLQNIINRYALLTDRPVWACEQDDAFVVQVPLLTN